MNEQEFPQGSVPVAVAARVYGKDASWVRAGIVSGWLPIGKATRSGKLVTPSRRWIHAMAVSTFTSPQSVSTRRQDFCGKENDNNGNGNPSGAV